MTHVTRLNVYFINGIKYLSSDWAVVPPKVIDIPM